MQRVILPQPNSIYDSDQAGIDSHNQSIESSRTRTAQKIFTADANSTTFFSGSATTESQQYEEMMKADFPDVYAKCISYSTAIGKKVSDWREVYQDQRQMICNLIEDPQKQNDVFAIRTGNVNRILELLDTKEGVLTLFKNGIMNILKKISDEDKWIIQNKIYRAIVLFDCERRAVEKLGYFSIDNLITIKNNRALLGAAFGQSTEVLNTLEQMDVSKKEYSLAIGAVLAVAVNECNFKLFKHLKEYLVTTSSIPLDSLKIIFTCFFNFLRDFPAKNYPFFEDELFDLLLDCEKKGIVSFQNTQANTREIERPSVDGNICSWAARLGQRHFFQNHRTYAASVSENTASILLDENKLNDFIVMYDTHSKPLNLAAAHSRETYNAILRPGIELSDVSHFQQKENPKSIDQGIWLALWEHPLFHAIYSGNAPLVQEFCRAERYDEIVLRHALYLAAYTADLACFSYLLHQGAKVTEGTIRHLFFRGCLNYLDNLMIADPSIEKYFKDKPPFGSFTNDSPVTVDYCKWMIKHGVATNKVADEGYINPMTLLHHRNFNVDQTHMIKLLASHAPSILTTKNGKSGKGRTPLMQLLDCVSFYAKYPTVYREYYNENTEKNIACMLFFMEDGPEKKQAMKKIDEINDGFKGFSAAIKRRLDSYNHHDIEKNVEDNGDNNSRWSCLVM